MPVRRNKRQLTAAAQFLQAKLTVEKDGNINGGRLAKAGREEKQHSMSDEAWNENGTKDK
jgi:hypothetical protein